MRLTLTLLTLAALALPGCNTRKTTGTITLTGKVSELSDSGSARLLEGARVRAGCDLDGDGKLQPEEERETTTNAAGTFSLALGTLAGKSVTVRFSDDSTNTAVRSVVAIEGDQAAAFEVALVSIERLTCKSGSCVSPDKGLKVDGLAADFTVRGRTFNPVDEALAMPGGFVDADGTLLVSGVFATVEVEDGDGNRVEKLGTPATLRMRLPRETWAEVVDIAPGDDRIQVPMYAFDEAKGAFVREGEGYLEDGAGAMLPESRLAALRNGSLTGAVFSRSQASHFSTWNVDWPVTTQTCVGGILLRDDGQPAVGLTVEIEGLSYTGSSPAKQTDAEGRWCSPVLRSEKAGEDFGKVGAGNGVAGEKQQVAVVVRGTGDAWDLGEFTTPDIEGCACNETRRDTLSAANRLAPKVCTVSGKVIGSDGGVPPIGTSVSVDSIFDVPEDAPPCSDCSGSQVADADGGFTVRAQVLGALRLRGHAVRQVPGGNEFDEDSATAHACPSRPFTLRLRPTLRWLPLTIALTGQVISWTPAEPMVSITVTRGNTPIWLITGQDILPPVTVGQVPAGATAIYPFSGALASGDVVILSGSSTDAEGVDNMLNGTLTVP